MSWNLRCGALIAIPLLISGGCGPSAVGSPDDDLDGDGAPIRPSGDGGPSGCVGANCENRCPGGAQTTLTGVVTAPNGIDPVSGAVVYVPAGPITDFPREVSCEVCSQLTDSAIASTRTATDGSFELGPIPTAENAQPGASVTVVSQMGRFRKVSQIVINAPCDANRGADADFRLPGQNRGDDTVPNIAVATGDFDAMECVLLKIGLAEGSFDLFAGAAWFEGTATVGGFDALLRDLSRMKEYNIIFINCAEDTHEALLNDATVRGNIEAYVRSGGRLYVTDWSYDYIEQVDELAPVIDFAPGPSDDAPESPNAAAIGSEGITVGATVLEASLADWLRAVEVRSGDELINEANQVRIEHFVGGWVMQYAVPALESAVVWLSGQVSGEGLDGTLPLTTTFDYQECGRVLFSSYHTAGRGSPDDPLAGFAFPAYCASGSLSPQERVLEYLIFHIADCIVVD